MEIQKMKERLDAFKKEMAPDDAMFATVFSAQDDAFHGTAENLDIGDVIIIVQGLIENSEISDVEMQALFATVMQQVRERKTLSSIANDEC